MNENKFLYRAGFYLTDDKNAVIPFFNDEFWKKERISENMVAYLHRDTPIFISKNCENTAFLIGHAYNPVKMISDEKVLLEELLQKNKKEEFFEYISEFTGLFLFGIIRDKQLVIIGDATGMQCTFYGKYNGKIHIASHTYMFEEVCSVNFTTYVKKLINYKFYHLFGKALPGDITPYEEFKRLIPNHYVKFEDEITVKRFYPIKPYKIYNKDERAVALKQIADLMHNNLELIAKKWNKPAISVTGGCDSKTTLACANGLYDSFSFFSYISSEAEKVDAIAAQNICNKLGLEHKIYNIPEDDSVFSDIETIRKTLEINDGLIGKNNKNDVRKRAFFASNNDFDVEVKSWVSECGRAYYCKRFLKKKFPKNPSGRYLTTLYKVFLHNRKLVRQTNKIFEEYKKKYLETDIFNYPWEELFFWEFRMSSWNGQVITGEHKYSFDITIPYNNRLIIDSLLRFSSDDRINDVAYSEIRQLMNPAVDKVGISVTNVKHTKNRAKIERLYLEVMSKIFF